MFRAAAVLVVLATLAGCGSADPPRRTLRPLHLDARSVGPAFVKAVRTADAAALASGDLDALISQAQRNPALHLRASRVARGAIVARDVAVRTHGDAFSAEGTVEPSQLSSLAPAGTDLHYAGGLELKGRAKTPFGVSIDVTVKIVVRDGAVVAAPQNLPVGAVTLFADPRVYVTGLHATDLPGGRVRLRAAGTLTPR